MIRVAFTVLGGTDWKGGHHYLLNLLAALSEHRSQHITPVLFLAEESGGDAEDFARIPGLELVTSSCLDQRARGTALAQALLWGRSVELCSLFQEHRIDVVFESAQFFGWRLQMPAVAWIPDFQHRALPQLFTRALRWKRELGFRTQVAAGRTIMLSSENARAACESYYPASRGRTHTVHFAVPPGPAVPFSEARAIADSYDLPANFVFLPNQFWRHKNHTLVLEALDLLRARGGSVVIAASGKQLDSRAPDYFPAFEKDLADRGLESSLRLLGLIPYDHLGALMRSCQAMLNPSLFEGWSTTVEEARTMGTPMLLSDIDVHREQMGDVARYFQRDSAGSLADALEAVLPYDPDSRGLAALQATSEARLRVRAFADDFHALAVGVVDGPGAS